MYKFDVKNDGLKSWSDSTFQFWASSLWHPGKLWDFDCLFRAVGKDNGDNDNAETFRSRGDVFSASMLAELPGTKEPPMLFVRCEERSGNRRTQSFQNNASILRTLRRTKWHNMTMQELIQTHNFCFKQKIQQKNPSYFTLKQLKQLDRHLRSGHNNTLMVMVSTSFPTRWSWHERCGPRWRCLSSSYPYLCGRWLAQFDNVLRQLCAHNKSGILHFWSSTCPNIRSFGFDITSTF